MREKSGREGDGTEERQARRGGLRSNLACTGCSGVTPRNCSRSRRFHHAPCTPWGCARLSPPSHTHRYSRGVPPFPTPSSPTSPSHLMVTQIDTLVHPVTKIDSLVLPVTHRHARTHRPQQVPRGARRITTCTRTPLPPRGPSPSCPDRCMRRKRPGLVRRNAGGCEWS